MGLEGLTEWTEVRARPTTLPPLQSMPLRMRTQIKTVIISVDGLDALPGQANGSAH
jgi:hypothetical protein